MGEENGRGEGDRRGEGMGGRKRTGGRGWEEDDGEAMGEVGEAKKGRQTAHHDGEDNTDLLNNFEDAEHS